MAGSNPRPISLDLTSSPSPTLVSTPTATMTFISRHTEICIPPSPTDECSICLDAYTTEPCLRIKDIAGCNHLIGGICLRTMLENRPMDEKKCPLCRTVWIPEATPPSPPRRRSFALPQRVEHSLQRTQIVEATVTRRRREMEGTTTRNFPTPADMPLFRFDHRRPVHPGMLRHHTQGQRPNQPIIIDSASETEEEEEDYATQVQNYTSLTRDIAEIRRRAGTTPHQTSAGSRRQNRSETMAEETNSGGGNEDNGNNARRSGGNFSGTPGASVFTRFMHPSGRNALRPSVNGTAPPPAAATTGRLYDDANARRRARAQHTPSVRDEQRGLTLGQGVEEEIDGQDVIPTLPMPDFLRVPSIGEDIIISEPHTMPLRAHPRRTSESELNARHRFLDRREQALNQRHMDQVRREAALREGRGNLNAEVEALRRQEQYLQECLRRFQAELDRMLE